VGERFAPWLGDWYMAKTGVSSQQANEEIDAPREGNLFHPVGDDRGARGAYGDRAHGRSAVLWASKHRRVFAGAAALAGAFTAAGIVAALRP